MCRSNPKRSGLTPTAKATNWEKCNTGKPKLRPIAFATSGCRESRLRWHKGQGVTKQSARCHGL